MIGETFWYFGEAMIALDVIKAHAVITFCFHRKAVGPQVPAFFRFSY